MAGHRADSAAAGRQGHPARARTVGRQENCGAKGRTLGERQLHELLSMNAMASARAWCSSSGCSHFAPGKTTHGVMQPSSDEMGTRSSGSAAAFRRCCSAAVGPHTIMSCVAVPPVMCTYARLWCAAANTARLSKQRRAQRRPAWVGLGFRTWSTEAEYTSSLATLAPAKATPKRTKA